MEKDNWIDKILAEADRAARIERCKYRIADVLIRLAAAHETNASGPWDDVRELVSYIEGRSSIRE